jgi:DNA polymerase III sliding clamp (beta) subunit (PCNA family)
MDSVTIKAEYIKDILQFTSEDINRPMMQGIYFDNKKMIATDSRVLKMIDCTHNFSKMLIGKYVFESALKVPKIKEFDFWVENNRFFLQAGNFIFVDNISDLQFPNYTRVIPEYQEIAENYYTIESEEFERALIKTEKIRGKRMLAYFNCDESNIFKLSSKDYSGMNKVLVINIDFLNKIYNNENISFCCEIDKEDRAKKPLLFKKENELALVMPAQGE